MQQNLTTGRGWLRLALPAIVLLIVAISVLYKDVIAFECSATGLPGICLSISELPIRALCVVALLAVLSISPVMRRHAASLDLRAGPDPFWAGVFMAGVAMIAAPLFFLSNEISAPGFIAVLALWLGGAALAAIGAAPMLFTPASLTAAMKALPWGVWVALILAALSPDWARVIQPTWHWEPITAATFNTVEMVLSAMGMDVLTNTPRRIIQVGDFAVQVGEQCSGIEGLGLITLFFGVFVVLFRDRINMRRAWILWPIGLAVSWMFNIVRVTALIWIGANVSPDLAVNGFHSHAGWMFFAILSVSLCLVANAIGWFRSAPAAPASPTQRSRQHELSLQMVPFIVLMAMLLARSTFSQTPEALYPLQFAALTLVLAYFWRDIRDLLWRVQTAPIIAGALIAVVWIVANPASGGTSDPSALWIITRVLGTIILIPVIEELFFRGYIIDKFRTRGMAGLWLGVIISSVLFMFLHDAWVLAFGAGVVFGWLVIRKNGRLTDAIIAHMVANAGVAAAAFATGNWAWI